MLDSMSLLSLVKLLFFQQSNPFQMYYLTSFEQKNTFRLSYFTSSTIITGTFVSTNCTVAQSNTKYQPNIHTVKHTMLRRIPLHKRSCFPTKPKIQNRTTVAIMFQNHINRQFWSLFYLEKSHLLSRGTKNLLNNPFFILQIMSCLFSSNLPSYHHFESTTK